VIRQIVLDPLLPDPRVRAGERAAMVTAMRSHDRLGRACWAGNLRQRARPGYGKRSIR